MCSEGVVAGHQHHHVCLSRINLHMRLTSPPPPFPARPGCLCSLFTPNTQTLHTLLPGNLVDLCKAFEMFVDLVTTVFMVMATVVSHKMIVEKMQMKAEKGKVGGGKSRFAAGTSGQPNKSGQQTKPARRTSLNNTPTTGSLHINFTSVTACVLLCGVLQFPQVSARKGAIKGGDSDDDSDDGSEGSGDDAKGAPQAVPISQEKPKVVAKASASMRRRHA